MSGAIKVPEGRVTGRLDTVEMVLILFILCLWAFVIRIFLNKWGESTHSPFYLSKDCMPGIARGHYTLSFSFSLSCKTNLKSVLTLGL